MSASRARRYGGRLAIAAVLSALLAPGVLGAASAAGLSAAKPKSSWKLVRTETFSGSALPAGCEQYTGKYVTGKNAWSKSEVKVSKGVLQLKLEKKKTSGQPYTAGAIGCWGKPQKYGKYEIKAKVPAGTGISSALTLTPAKASKTSATAFTGIELLAPGPETAYVTNGSGTKSESAQITGNYSGKFRTYVIEWAPKHIRMAVDGKEIYYSNRAVKESRWLGLVVSSGDALTGVPDSTTKLPARLDIDQIKISSYTGVPPKAGTLTPTASPTPTSTPGSSSAAAGASVPTPAGGTVPPTGARSVATALKSTSSDTGPTLTGGIWPWLLGGSLVAVFAIISLNYPLQRRTRTGGPVRQ